MTEVELARIDFALESVGGNRAQAAAILEIPTKSLNNKIRNNLCLREKWMFKNSQGAHAVGAPTEAPTFLQTIQVPAPRIPPVTPAEQEIAVIYERENAALKKGFTEIGLNEEESQAALDMTRFYGNHAAELCDLFGGTLARHAIRLSTLLSDLEQDIKDKKFRDIYSPDGGVMVRSGEESKFEIYYRGIDQLRKLKNLVDTGRIAHAKIRMWEQHGKNGNNGKGRKPGFSPLGRQTLVQVQPGATVNLNDGRLNGMDSSNDGSGPEAHQP